MPRAIHITVLRNHYPAIWVLVCWLGIQAALIPSTSGSRHPANTADSANFAVYPAAALEMSSEASVKSEAGIQSSLARLPLHFEANLGQAEERFSFISRAGGYELLLGNAEATLVLTHLQRSDLGLPDKKSDGSSAVPERPQSQVRNIKQSVLRMKLIGANASARILGLEPLPVKSNYFIGNDPRKWRTEVPSYARVKYEEVYPGIDLVFYGNQRQLEYDFIVAPGATPEGILLKFEGADRISVGATGDLILETPAGRILQHNPTVYQEIDGTRQKIECHFAIERNGENGQVGFKVGSYDSTRPLVIDPVVAYSTFLGGSNQHDLGNDVAIDPHGNVYITGVTYSPDFPVASALQPTRQGSPFGDAFVAKLNPTGTALIYSTYLGGGYVDEASRIAVDKSGNAYVIGRSGSADFPTTAGSLQPLKTTLFDQFIAKISPDGGTLSYSTYLKGVESLNDVAVDRIGNTYLTGLANSVDFSTTAGAFQTNGRSNLDAFVAKLNSSGNSMVYSTFLGGSNVDIGVSLTVDNNDHAYVTGYTHSLNFPTTSLAFQPIAPMKIENLDGSDVFVTRLNADGSSLIYSTFLAGNGMDKGLGISIDPSGNAYITGATNSLDFPTTPETLQTKFSGGLLKSNNGGAKWGSTLGLLSPNITSLAISPPMPSTVYAATDAGVFKSTDRGSHWVPLKLMGFRANVLAADPVNPLVVYAGGFAPSVNRSTDGGMTWQPASDGLPRDFRVLSFLIDQNEPSILYAGGAGFFNTSQPAALPTGDVQLQPPPPLLKNLFTSTDAGRTWVEIHLPSFPPVPVTVLSQDPKTNSLYASSAGLLHKSRDRGVSWRRLDLNEGVMAVAIDPAHSATVYAGTLNGLFKSSDGGERWTAMSTGLPPETQVNVVAIDPETPVTIFAGTDDGVFKSTDAATSWAATLIGGDIQALALDPAQTGRVFVAVRDFSDAFLTKLSPTGGSVVYSTFLGGRSEDSGFGIAVSAAGSAYVTGRTFSTNYPTLAAVQPNREPGTPYTAFITKLNASGDALAYSTYLGGGQSVQGSGTTANGIALAMSGIVYIAGDTYSPDFPTVNALQPGFGGGDSDCFLTKFVEPRIDQVSPQGKNLIVSGEFFDPNAVVLLDGKARNTTPDVSSPTKTLIATKAGKKIKPGKTVTIQVRNSNGEVSEPFLFAPGGPGIASRGLRIEVSRVAGLHACLPFAEIRRFEARYWQSRVCTVAEPLAGRADCLNLRALQL
jgi:photosystem II stability/assembly factor-like uncharacterized protein